MLALLQAAMVAAAFSAHAITPGRAQRAPAGESGGDARDGRHVYERYCIQCHGTKGDGAGEVARWAQPKPRDFREGIYKFRSTPYGSLPTVADLDHTIRSGLYGTLMPPFAAISARDRDDVIAYLQTFSPRWRAESAPTPITVPGEPTPTREDIIRGRLLFSANCSVCHGDGTGNGPSAAGIVDAWGNPLRPADLTQGRGKSARSAGDIYLRVMTGINGTPMPGFAGALSPTAAWQVAHYVEALGSWEGSTPTLRAFVATLPPPSVAAAADTAGARRTTSVAPGVDTTAPGGAASPRAGTIVVRMIGDAQGYRFEPSTINAHVGDVIQFVNTSGGPHNVTFWADSIPAGSATPLAQNMGPTMSPLSGVLLTTPNQEYRVSLANLPPGTYKFHCLPHLALHMVGELVLQR
jgi:plastocyanin